MDRLWAPWRYKYLLDDEKEEGCIFCNAPKGDERKKYVLYKGNHSYVIMNIYPYNNGHLMVVPYDHEKDIENLKENTYKEMFELLQLCVKVLKEVYNPEGFNIGMNLGRVAGAGVDNHLHIHIVPRWNGDTNFMPLFGEAKILSIDIDRVYDDLKEVFEKYGRKNG